MINKKIEEMLIEDTSSMIIPAKNTSMVFSDNSLMHAMLILNNVNYTSIPVLDYENKFIGLISNHRIMKFMQDKNPKGFEELNDYKVSDAIDTRFHTVRENFSVEEVLGALVNYNFICIVDDEGTYKGIITRSTILKRVNYLVHELDKKFFLEEKVTVLQSS